VTSQVSRSAVDLYLVVEELDVLTDVEDLVVCGLRAVDGKFLDRRLVVALLGRVVLTVGLWLGNLCCGGFRCACGGGGFGGFGLGGWLLRRSLERD